ncbi:MAG: hypothetical protein RR294_05850 [Bacilli bacterium]
MKIKRRRKNLNIIKSLEKYQNYSQEIRVISASNNGNILVNSSEKMINLDAIVANLGLEVKSTDAIHYNSLKNTLYIIEFKSGSILNNVPNGSCSLGNNSCTINTQSKKSKNKEIRANLILKGIDTYLIILRKLLTEKEYNLIIDKNIKLVYIIVNSSPIINTAKQNRLSMLSHLDSIHSRIPTIFKRYEKELFDKVIFESDTYFKREILAKLY